MTTFGRFMLTSIPIVYLGAVLAGHSDASDASPSPVIKAVAELDALGGTYGVKQPKGAEKEAIEVLGYDIRMYWDVMRVSLGPGNAPYDPKTPITDERLAALRNTFLTLQNIEVLDLRYTEISDEGLRSLPPMLKLKILRLDGTKIGDGIQEILVRFPNLESLSIIEAKLTEQGITKIQEKYPKLKVVLTSEN
ncbi:hypothetical protein SH449x_003550 [Pirellulaceae bacterium SH449]